MTKRTVKTEKELAQALKDNIDTILIEGSLANKTLKIHATGKVAWAVAFGALGVAVYALISIPATGGTSTPAAVSAGFIGGGALTATLGAGAATTAISIAVAAGGVGALTTLRGYKKVSCSPGKLILKKK